MKVFEFDTNSPAQIAEKVQSVGAAKTRLPLPAMMMLGVCAGGFIGLGALYYTLIASDSGLPFAAARVLGGWRFRSVSFWSWSRARSFLPATTCSSWRGPTARSRPPSCCETGRWFISQTLSARSDWR